MKKKMLKIQQLKKIVRKWAKDIKKHFIKDEIQMANKYMKRSSMLCH